MTDSTLDSLPLFRRVPALPEPLADEGSLDFDVLVQDFCEFGEHFHREVGRSDPLFDQRILDLRPAEGATRFMKSAIEHASSRSSPSSSSSA
jgi:hypothetical protein